MSDLALLLLGRDQVIDMHGDFCLVFTASPKSGQKSAIIVTDALFIQKKYNQFHVYSYPTEKWYIANMIYWELFHIQC